MTRKTDGVSRFTCRTGFVLLVAMIMGLAPVLAWAGGEGESDSQPGGVRKVRIILDGWAISDVPFRQLAEKYSALNPGIEIAIEPTPGAWGTKVAAQQKSGKLEWSAAGITMPFLDLYGAARTNSAVPIDGFISTSKLAESKGLLDDLLPVLRQDGSYDGKFFMIPYSVENIMMHYRTDYAAAAGITKAPRSWDELYQACVAVKKSMEAAGRKDVYPLVFDLDLIRGIGPLFFSATEKPYTKEGMLDWQSAEMKKALQWMRKMVAEGLMPPMAGEGAELADMWRRGRIAFYYAPSSRGVWAQKIVGFDKVASTSIPTIDGKPKSGTFFWGNCLQVFRGAPHAQEVVDFLVWAMGPQNVEFQKAVIKSGKGPVYTSVYNGMMKDDPELAPYAWMQDMKVTIEESIPATKTYFQAMERDAWNKYRIDYFRTGSVMTEEQLVEKIIAHIRDLEVKVAVELKNL